MYTRPRAFAATLHFHSLGSLLPFIYPASIYESTLRRTAFTRRFHLPINYFVWFAQLTPPPWVVNYVNLPRTGGAIVPPPAPGRGFREVGRLQWATGAERGISRQVPHLSWEPGMAVGCMRSLDGAWRRGGGVCWRVKPPQGARYILCWGCRLGAEYALARFLR